MDSIFGANNNSGCDSLTLFGSGSENYDSGQGGGQSDPPPSILKTKRRRTILKTSMESYRHYLHDKKIIFVIRQKMTSQ